MQLSTRTRPGSWLPAYAGMTRMRGRAKGCRGASGVQLGTKDATHINALTLPTPADANGNIVPTATLDQRHPLPQAFELA